MTKELLRNALAGGVCLPYDTGKAASWHDPDVLYAGKHTSCIDVVYDGYPKRYTSHGYRYVTIGLELHRAERDEHYTQVWLISRELREKLEAALCGCL